MKKSVLLEAKHFLDLSTQLKNGGLHFDQVVDAGDREIAGVWQLDDTRLARFAKRRPTRAVLNPVRPTPRGLLRLLNEAQRQEMPNEPINSGNAQYAISSGTGSLAYVSGGVQGAQNKLVWVSRNGVEEPVAAPARAYGYPRLSPDGKWVAATVREQETHVWTYDLRREAPTRLTSEGNVNGTPQWTPDGKRIAFESNRAGPLNIFWQLADGSGGIERLTTSEFVHSPSSFSPDGQLLAYAEINPTTGYDIWVLRLSNPSAGSGQNRNAQPFLLTSFTETAPKFSSDGHWLAYASDQSGRFEIYVQPYPGPGGKWPISNEGGMEPVWNPNGGELFYRRGNKMMVVDVETKSGFSAGKPRVLFDAGSYLPTAATSPNYDVSRDGRFLMVKPSEQQGQAATQINVVLNWFEELKQHVPVR